MNLDDLTYTCSNLTLNLTKWFNDSKDKFEKLEDDCRCYKLRIDRPSWFRCKRFNNKKHNNESSKIDVEDIDNYIFIGKSEEEVFLKMYKFCLLNFKWKDGKVVNLFDYLKPPDLDEVIHTSDDKIKCIYQWELDEDYDQNEIDDGIILLLEAYRNKWEPLLIKYIMENKMQFYFESIDCCFGVEQLETL